MAPWLDAQLEPAADGGTTLTGTIGPHPAVRDLSPVFFGLSGLVVASGLAGGNYLLVSGHLAGLAVMAAPLAWVALLAGITVANLRQAEPQVGELLREVNEILGSTVVCAGPAACGSG